jgi:endonuclease/exonuclease/phosphatase family metal-dependent hydrolase
MTPEVLTVVSYNLKDYGKSAVATRRQQHELLRFARPDVVCLQEIWDDGEDLAALHRHVATLADALGMRAMAVPARRTHCHMAILWRPQFAALSQHSARAAAGRRAHHRRTGGRSRTGYGNRR